MQKYKIQIWNFGCFALIALSAAYLAPRLDNVSSYTEDKKEPSPVVQKKTVRKLYKRGSLASSSTITEQKSTTYIGSKKKHEIDGWTTITFNKDKDDKDDS